MNRKRALYEHALEGDPLNNTVATNLGIIEARAGHTRRAVELWLGAFERAPQQSAIGINLALPTAPQAIRSKHVATCGAYWNSIPISQKPGNS